MNSGSAFLPGHLVTLISRQAVDQSGQSTEHKFNPLGVDLGFTTTENQGVQLLGCRRSTMELAEGFGRSFDDKRRTF